MSFIVYTSLCVLGPAIIALGLVLSSQLPLAGNMAITLVYCSHIGWCHLWTDKWDMWVSLSLSHSSSVTHSPQQKGFIATPSDHMPVTSAFQDSRTWTVITSPSKMHLIGVQRVPFSTSNLNSGTHGCLHPDSGEQCGFHMPFQILFGFHGYMCAVTQCRACTEDFEKVINPICLQCPGIVLDILNAITCTDLILRLFWRVLWSVSTGCSLIAMPEYNWPSLIIFT